MQPRAGILAAREAIGRALSALGALLLAVCAGHAAPQASAPAGPGRCYAVSGDEPGSLRAIIVPIAHYATRAMTSARIETLAAALGPSVHIVFESGGGVALPAPLAAAARVGDLPAALRERLRAAAQTAFQDGGRELGPDVVEAWPVDWLGEAAAARCASELGRRGLVRVELDLLRIAAVSGWPVQFLETQQEFASSVDAAPAESKARSALAQLETCTEVGDTSVQAWQQLERGKPLQVIQSAAHAAAAKRGLELPLGPQAIERDRRLRERLARLLRDGPPGALVFIGLDHLSPRLDAGSRELPGMQPSVGCIRVKVGVDLSR